MLFTCALYLIRIGKVWLRTYDSFTGHLQSDKSKKPNTRQSELTFISELQFLGARFACPSDAQFT